MVSVLIYLGLPLIKLMELSSLVSSLPVLIGMLPLILQVTQILSYLFFIWFFGTLAMRGYRGKKTMMLKISGTLLTGAICFLASASFAGFVPFLNEGILSILQLDMLVAGIVVCVVMAISINLITHQNPALKPEEFAEKLRRKVVALEDMLKNRKAHISEKEARDKAEKVMPGYKAQHAKIIDNDYEVAMKKGDSEALVVLDIWDGEVRTKIKHESAIMQMLTDPEKLAGLAVIAIILVSSLLFFEGFPNPAEDMASMFGMSMDDLGAISQRMQDSPLLGEDMPAGCASPIVFTNYYSQMTDRQFVLDHIYEDAAIKQTASSECGGEVQGMIRIDHEGQDLVIAILSSGRVAYLTDGILCMCVDAAG